MRVAAIDIGTNSTRLLIADVGGVRRVGGVARGAPGGAGAGAPGGGFGIVEIERHSIVTRLGDGVDASGRLDGAAIDRVFEAVGGYRALIDAHGVEAVAAVATSAVRDAANGGEFRDRLHERFGVDVATIGGDEEATLTFAGVTHGGVVAHELRTLVVDVGGGSTEFIVGQDGRLDFHVSTQIGAVRQSERHLVSDPPAAVELAAMRLEIAELIDRAIPAAIRGRAGVDHAVAVAGTATVLASIDQALDPFDPAKVHGYTLTAAACEAMLGRLAALPLARRRTEVVGLHPDRAPTIVAGAAIIVETLAAFGLSAVEVSEHDILYGLLLRAAETAAAARD